MTDPTTPKKKGAALGWYVLIGSAVGVFALGLLGTSIMERRQEAAVGRVQIVQPLADFEPDSAKWGVNFPRQYSGWRKTAEMGGETMFAGSVAKDYLEKNPRLVVLWAGHAFARGYNAPRGHFHATEDTKNTPRRTDKTPATCWTCKSSDVSRVMARDGVAEFYSKSFNHYLEDMDNSIGCADCHNPQTMALQISRPALRDGLKAKGKEVAKATHQEMRSLACAQCHSEYYFKGKGNYLTFPWKDGITAEGMETYYRGTEHADWTHAISGAKMIKMQHPDYELFMQGIHAARGVGCADCHMPYKTEGGVKFSDHQTRSPLLNIANSCQVCHRWDEASIKERVYSIQIKTHESLGRAEDALVALHLEIGQAMKEGATDAQLESARTSVRYAQMYWDYVAAAKGMGFHAPQESQRVLGKALDIAQKARLDLALLRGRMGNPNVVALPDISTKEKAQAYIKPFVEAQQAAAAKLAARKEGSGVNTAR